MEGYKEEKVITNLLPVKIETINNFEKAIDNISRKYKINRDYFDLKFRDDKIIVTVLGVKRYFDYYTKHQQNAINKEEMDSMNFDLIFKEGFKYKYENIYYSPLTVEDIEERIINIFTVEDVVYKKID